MLRGTSEGLEFVFPRGSFFQTLESFRRQLSGRADFYRGSSATAIVDGDAPEASAFGEFVAEVRSHGIELRGVYGGEAVEAVAAACGLSYLGSPRRPAASSLGDLARRRAARASEALTEAARSLDADFAGARADLAARRARRPLRVAAVVQRSSAPAIDATVTRYYRGTVRGGQSLQQVGNIVVVGDVNPGAELVASGDVVVFGALRGTAHAGAQGDRAARVAALELAPTQLRIAACIAAGDDEHRVAPAEAHIEGERIVIVPLFGVRA